MSGASRASGDGAAADVVARLRNHLALHPDDAGARLELGQILLRLDERRAARAILEPLEGACAAITADLRSSALRLLAELDEREGALASAQMRWERLLADDVDDADARHNLARLQPRVPAPTAEFSLDTLASPAGATTARYRLIRELGRGSTATVYLVRDERLDLPLALKVLHPQFASAAQAQARGRFFAEARLAARVRHPGVVAIYDIDEATRSLAMEYVPGGTLRERIRRHPTPASVVLEIARSLLDTLSFVHAAGVIHGDLKPGNILCRDRDQIVLADFGAAEIAPGVTELLRPPPGRHAPSGDDRPGTPLYLAPEQFHGARPSTATDLFAAGLVLWELVAGRPARQQSHLVAGADAELPPVPRIDWGQDWGQEEALGQRLSEIIAALTARRPQDRPGSASQAHARLLA